MVQRAWLDGSHVVTVASGQTNAYGLALDASNEMIYWGMQNRVMRAGLDGSTLQQVLSASSSVYAVEIDAAQNRVYAFDSEPQKFGYAPMSGGTLTYCSWWATSFSPDAVVSPGTNWIYFTDYTNKAIRRFDRTAPTTSYVVASSVGQQPDGIAIDSSAGKLYWSCNSSIYRANLDGSGATLIVSTSGTTLGVALDLTGGYIYYSGYSSILRAPLAGGATQTIIPGGTNISDVKIASGLPLKWAATSGGNWDGSNWSYGFSPSAAENVRITPSNGLVVAGSASAASVKSLTIGAQTSGVAELQLSNNFTAANGLAVQTGGKITLGNVALDAGSGLTIDGAGIVTGTGVIYGNISGTAGEAGLTPNGSASLTAGLTVGSRKATLLSQTAVNVGPTTTISGGSLVAPNGVVLNGGDTVSGYGLIRGTISGCNAEAGMVATDTYYGTGTLNVGADPWTILSKNIANPGDQTTLAGGTLKSNSGVAIRAGQSLSGFGTVTAKISGSADSLIQAGGGQLTLGDVSRLDGFVTDGNLDIGANTAVLNSKAFASLGSLTTINGGTLQAANGVSLGVGRNLSGSGTVNAKMAAGFGSTIQAMGNLALGNASSPVGFASDGELYTEVNTVTLNDSNQAVLGSLTQIGDGAGNSGTLIATNGLLVDFGRNLVGQGVVQSTNSLARAVIVNGAVEGTGSGLEFTGYVKGVGTFSGTPIFSGTYAPGLSPASVNLENMKLKPTSTLAIEIGGKTPGSQYDVVNLSGAGTLDGTLQVSLLNGFRPAHNDQFTVLTFGSKIGDFVGTSGLDLGSRLVLTPQYTTNSLVLTAVQGGSGAWSLDQDGSISNSQNWGNATPNGTADTATFSSTISQPRTLTVDSPTTFGGMQFNSLHRYTIAGNAALTLQAASGNAQVDVQSGSHEISAPVSLNSDAAFNAAGGNLTISGSITGTHGLTKQGSGTVTLAGSDDHSGSTTVSVGTLRVTGTMAGNGSGKVFVAKDADGTFGNIASDAAIVRRVMPGAHKYGGLGSAITNLGSGELSTTADIVDGNASAQFDVSMAWRTRTAAEKTKAGGGLLSEIVDLSGMAISGGGVHHGSQQTDTFVLQMSYDESELGNIWNLTEAEAVAQDRLNLGYLDLGADGLLGGTGANTDHWTLAVNGNFGGTPNFVGDHAYSDSYFTLGDYGVDTAHNTVWAVVNHNSQFAAVPEPATIALLAAGGFFLLGYGWRRRRSL